MSTDMSVDITHSKQDPEILPGVKDVNFNCEKNLAEFSIAFLPLRIIKAYP